MENVDARSLCVDTEVWARFLDGHQAAPAPERPGMPRVLSWFTPSA
jgi:hypothetical protein